MHVHMCRYANAVMHMYVYACSTYPNAHQIQTNIHIEIPAKLTINIHNIITAAPKGGARYHNNNDSMSKRYVLVTIV